MRAICVDDEPLVLALTVDLCREVSELSDVKGFDEALEALAWVSENDTDIAFVDIDMPRMNGLELAMKLKEIRPDIAIVFLTGYAEFALDAFKQHASGYLLKPVDREQIEAEVRYARSRSRRGVSAHIEIRTFGEFDLLIDGEPVTFPRTKAKELLAYLVDRQGASVNRKMLASVLWEDALYDRAKQKYLDSIIRCLRDTLDKNGAGDILEMKQGTLRIVPGRFECDIYRFFAGDVDAINAYRGEYMSAYSWASMSEAYIDRIKYE